MTTANFMVACFLLGGFVCHIEAQGTRLTSCSNLHTVRQEIFEDKNFRGFR